MRTYIKDINDSLEKDLFAKPDYNGESVYFLDKELTKPYTGILIETYDNYTIWWSEYINEVQNGIEKVFNDDGQLEQISECKNNMHVGISKEYDESNKLIFVAIKWNNGYVKKIYLDENKNIIKKEEDESWIRNFPIPDNFLQLIKLSDQELINYEFKIDNPNLSL